MRAIVVYESLWGNTAAIAEAIAEGLGSGTVARPTSEATSALLDGVDLVVAGAPVHMMALPKEKTREKARRRGERPGVPAPDLSGEMMRDWLAGLDRSVGAAAAFDTRIASQRGGASAARILRGLRRARYRAIAPPESFIVERLPNPPGSSEGRPSGSGVKLAEGERERAREWGAHLAQLHG